MNIEVQKALDIIRVTGNNAVHSGMMDLLNFIVDKMIVQPMEIEKLFNYLPEGALEVIEKRDKINA